MKTTREIKLIDGDFTPSEAKALLLNMLNYKLNFHNIKKLSSYERYGKEDEFSLNRIKELNESIATVNNLFGNLIKPTQPITIRSYISMNVAEETILNIEVA
jgi:hypothetical protein